jgi:DNA-binding FadR family transcriptional regulator
LHVLRRAADLGSVRQFLHRARSGSSFTSVTVARIAAGDLLADTRLPGERELAAEYGVAIGTARRAVEELRERDLVVTLPGKGTYVIGAPRS